jgi:hypothetical protein
MSTGGEVANALVCKTSIRGFNSLPVLHIPILWPDLLSFTAHNHRILTVRRLLSGGDRVGAGVIRGYNHAPLRVRHSPASIRNVPSVPT